MAAAAHSGRGGNAKRENKKHTGDCGTENAHAATFARIRLKRNIEAARELFHHPLIGVIAMKNILKCAAVLVLLFASASAYADDPTGVLLKERGLAPRNYGPNPRFSDVGPCGRGAQSEPFPNGQGFRCVRIR